MLLLIVGEFGKVPHFRRRVVDAKENQNIEMNPIIFLSVTRNKKISIVMGHLIGIVVVLLLVEGGASGFYLVRKMNQYRRLT